MKNVYYESDADWTVVEKIEIESKNFTIYRSIEDLLQPEKYQFADRFACFTPTAVWQLEGELFTRANEMMNWNIDQIQKLSKFETDLLMKHGLPQVVYSISG